MAREDIKDLVNYVKSGDAVKVRDCITDALSNRINDRIEQELQAPRVFVDDDNSEE